MGLNVFYHSAREAQQKLNGSYVFFEGEIAVVHQPRQGLCNIKTVGNLNDYGDEIDSRWIEDVPYTDPRLTTIPPVKCGYIKRTDYSYLYFSTGNQKQHRDGFDLNGFSPYCYKFILDNQYPTLQEAIDIIHKRQGKTKFKVAISRQIALQPRYNNYLGGGTTDIDVVFKDHVIGPLNDDHTVTCNKSIFADVLQRFASNTDLKFN